MDTITTWYLIMNSLIEIILLIIIDRYHYYMVFDYELINRDYFIINNNG